MQVPHHKLMCIFCVFQPGIPDQAGLQYDLNIFHSTAPEAKPMKTDQKEGSRFWQSWNILICAVIQ